MQFVTLDSVCQSAIQKNDNILALMYTATVRRYTRQDHQSAYT